MGDGWHNAWDRTDDVGFTPSHRVEEDMFATMADFHQDIIRRKTKADQAVRNELVRLNDLWRAS